MKILFLTNIPSPYRVNFFNELGKLCELTVVFECQSSTERDDSWKKFEASHFSAVFLRGIRKGVANAFCPGIIKYLSGDLYDHIVVTNFTSPTGMLAILWMRLQGIPYWLESDGGFAKCGRGLKERLKKYFIKDASGYFSTAQEHDRYYIQYGADPERIHRYPFTSLYRKDILNEPISFEQKTSIRKELGIVEPNVILAVGQFIHRKGFDVLLNAMSVLPKNIGCYIVGGIPTEEYCELVEKYRLDNVHFVGFQSEKELKAYYRAADLMVHPTREDIWGLVVNEAMATGLPVVTTDRCIAGLELIMERGEGVIVSAEDAVGLREAIKCVLHETNEDSSKRILRKMENYCFEKMAERHIDILKNRGVL